jgi:hypothetical protein
VSAVPIDDRYIEIRESFANEAPDTVIRISHSFAPIIIGQLRKIISAEESASK